MLSGKVLWHGTGLGWAYKMKDPAADVEVPIRLQLDDRGLPVELTVDYSSSAVPSNSFKATFSYGADVEEVPAVSNPRVYDMAAIDPCENNL